MVKHHLDQCYKVGRNLIAEGTASKVYKLNSDYLIKGYKKLVRNLTPESLKFGEIPPVTVDTTDRCTVFNSSYRARLKQHPPIKSRRQGCRYRSAWFLHRGASNPPPSFLSKLLKQNIGHKKAGYLFFWYLSYSLLNNIFINLVFQ